MNSDNIEDIKGQFLKKNLPAKNLFVEPLPNDASMRFYDRISFADKTLLLMDSSREKRSLPPFVKINEFLHNRGYSVPKIIAKDMKAGLLLLEDFGPFTYTKLLEENRRTDFEFELYKKAADVLIKLHKEKIDIELPEYNYELLMDELLLLIDWYFPILNDKPLSDKLRGEYIAIWKTILERIHYKNSCLVLRDYHVDNIMFLENRIGIQSVGLLDFQDAVVGSYAYDLVSLLEDARRDISATLSSKILHHYIDKTSFIDKQKFLSDYAILGTQRSCKIVGIFARKAIRDKNKRYLIHLPRVWNYIRMNIKSPIMKPLAEWFAKIDIPIIRDR